MIKKWKGSALHNSDGGHGGGDTGLMNHYVKLLKGEAATRGITTIEVSLESHLLTFAAEKAREEGIVVKMENMRR